MTAISRAKHHQRGREQFIAGLDTAGDLCARDFLSRPIGQRAGGNSGRQHGDCRRSVGIAAGIAASQQRRVNSIYCTGLGPVSNQPPTGVAASGSSMTPLTPTVMVGGVSLPVSFSGLAPGFFGLYQVNAQITQTVPTGSAVPVTVSIGGALSNTVTIAVQ